MDTFSPLALGRGLHSVACKLPVFLVLMLRHSCVCLLPVLSSCNACLQLVFVKLSLLSLDPTFNPLGPFPVQLVFL
eukprot:1093616-Pleurochrysis_carterae.AAC.1